MSAEPTIKAVTWREKRVFLRWSEGGPVIDVPLMDKQAALTYLVVKHEQDKEPHIGSARGLYCKKDGSVGTRTADIYIRSMDRLPEDVRAAALAALKGVAW